MINNHWTFTWNQPDEHQKGLLISISWQEEAFCILLCAKLTRTAMSWDPSVVVVDLLFSLVTTCALITIHLPVMPHLYANMNHQRWKFTMDMIASPWPWHGLFLFIQSWLYLHGLFIHCSNHLHRMGSNFIPFNAKHKQAANNTLGISHRKEAQLFHKW